MPNPAQVIAMGVVMPIVDGAFLAMRLYSRRNSAAKFGLDDLFVSIAWVVSIALGIILIIGAVAYGYGQSSSGTSAESGFTDNTELLNNTKKMSDFFNFLTPFSLGPCKLSLLFFYRRIFRGRVFNILCWSCIALVIIWIIVFFFVPLFQCGPYHITFLWSSAQNITQYCSQGAPIAYSYSSIDVATDLMILCMPIYWVSKLHMSRSKKLIVLSIFLFGSLAAAASLARLIVYVLIYPGHNSNPDQFGYATDIAYFSMLEVGLAIIASCLPVLGGLLPDSTKESIGRFLGNIIPSRFMTGSSFATGTTAKHPSTLKNQNSISRTYFVPNGSTTAASTVETYAMADTASAQRTSDDNGIVVTKDTTQEWSHV